MATKLDPVDIDATEPAKKKAPEAMKLITAGQLANLIAMHSDDIEGPQIAGRRFVFLTSGGSHDDQVFEDATG